MPPGRRRADVVDLGDDIRERSQVRGPVPGKLTGDFPVGGQFPASAQIASERLGVSFG
jgi:hypothetical protein